MTRPATRLAVFLAQLGIALLVAAGLGGCSGAVSGPPPVNDPTRITILPDGTAASPVIAYSGLPTTFTISGGTGAYIVSSDNQAIIPVSGPINGMSFTVTPNPVLSDTTVTITVRDTGTAPLVTTSITVKPGTLFNNITITPTSTLTCGGAQIVCSGGDALVSVTVSQGGIPLAARSVQFDVITGTFSFVSTDPMTGIDTLVSTLKVTTDQTGNATARMRIPALAPNQSALLQTTDLGTGAFQQTSFVISQSTGSVPGFFLVPSSLAFQGPIQGQCATTANAQGYVSIFGGIPPYTVQTSSTAFGVNPPMVFGSGGAFLVQPNGTCVPTPGTPIVVVDASGHTATTTVTNIPGTVAAPALAVAPDNVTLSSCDGKASATIAGGVSNRYFASSGSTSLDISLTTNVVTINRHNPSPATAGPLNVGVSDGTTVADITVTLDGAGAGSCPTFAASPTSVTLTSCSAQTVTVVGGSGAYSAVSSDANVIVTVSGGNVSIGRKVPSAGFFNPPPATVTITDVNNPPPSGPQIAIPINGSAAGLGPC